MDTNDLRVVSYSSLCEVAQMLAGLVCVVEDGDEDVRVEDLEHILAIVLRMGGEL